MRTAYAVTGRFRARKSLGKRHLAAPRPPPNQVTLLSRGTTLPHRLTKMVEPPRRRKVQHRNAWVKISLTAAEHSTTCGPDTDGRRDRRIFSGVLKEARGTTREYWRHQAATAVST